MFFSIFFLIDKNKQYFSTHTMKSIFFFILTIFSLQYTNKRELKPLFFCSPQLLYHLIYMLHIVE